MILEDRVDVNGTCGVPDCGVHAGSRVTNHMADGKVAGKQASRSDTMQALTGHASRLNDTYITYFHIVTSYSHRFKS